MVSTVLSAGAQTFPEWPDLTYTSYSWFHPELNNFQFYNRKAIEPLFEKLHVANDKKVTILHIGDSHLQADIYTGETRDLMQQAFGYGGRGLVFPYSTGHTHTAVDYTSEHTGRWLYAKNVEQSPELPLGIMGISSKTFDSSASFKLRFRNTILPEFKKVRVFLQSSPESYDFVLKTSTEEIFVDVYKEDQSTFNYVDVMLFKGDNLISIQLKKTDPAQNAFELYGLSIENPEDKGVLYHSVGINGAGYYSLLRENLLEEQLNYIQPDAVILDIGANDYWKKGIDESAFSQNMDKMVQLLRRYNPNISIIFSNSQDIYRGGYSIVDCGIASDMIAAFCRENNCSFYDWYWISGGRYAMANWRREGLCNKDYIHLTSTGYRLKGQMLTEAFSNTFLWLDTSKAIKCVYDIDSLAHPPTDSTKNAEPPAVVTQGWIYHKVRSGQSIWTIAKLYGVTGAQIRSWNHLKSNYLYKGQVIKIYTKLNTPAVATPTTPTVITPNAPKPTVPAKATPEYHKVKSGETLFGIAQKHHTTVDEIKRLNNLKSTTIKIGQVLRIK